MQKSRPESQYSPPCKSIVLILLYCSLFACEDNEGEERRRIQGPEFSLSEDASSKNFVVEFCDTGPIPAAGFLVNVLASGQSDTSSPVSARLSLDLPDTFDYDDSRSTERAFDRRGNPISQFGFIDTSESFDDDLCSEGFDVDFELLEPGAANFRWLISVESVDGIDNVSTFKVRIDEG